MICVKYEELISILLNSIEIIGIFVAIVVGLVVSKILSLKTEQSQLKSRISDIDKELQTMKNQYSIKKEENYDYYKEDVIYDILDSIFDEKEPDFLMDKIPHIEDNYKEEFYNYVTKYIYDLKDVIDNGKTSIEECKKRLKVKENSIEDIIINEIYERCGF